MNRQHLTTQKLITATQQAIADLAVRMDSGFERVFIELARLHGRVTDVEAHVAKIPPLEALVSRIEGHLETALAQDKDQLRWNAVYEYKLRQAEARLSKLDGGATA